MRCLILVIFLFISINVFCQEKDSSKVFDKVETEASFPGGDEAWVKYVSKAVTRHMKKLVRAGAEGTCLVRFIVDKNGNVSDATAISMQGTLLAEICVKVISDGPKWIPAFQFGKKVNAYRIQPIRFKMPAD
jgi:periplasmic protein TonB